MSVNISGAVLSSLFYEQNNCDTDNEGLLVGKVISHVTDTISDSHINNVKEETINYVYSFIPCIGLYNWYDSGGRVCQEKFTDMFQGITGQNKDIVGWYKFRRNSSFSVSLRERAIHRHLKECFPGLHMNNFLFCLCTSNTAQNHGIHSFDHTFFIYNGRTFQGLPVQVENLGDTAQSQSEYRIHGSQTVNPDSGVFSQSVQSFSSKMMARGKLKSVVSFQNLNEVLHQQLMELCQQVADTEAIRAKLCEEVDVLEAKTGTVTPPPPQVAQVAPHLLTPPPQAKAPLMEVSPEPAVPPDDHVSLPVESRPARRPMTGPIPVPTQTSSPLLPRKSTYHQKSPVQRPEPEHEQPDLIVLDDEDEDSLDEDGDTPQWKPLHFPVNQPVEMSANDSISNLESSSSSVKDPVDQVKPFQNPEEEPELDKSFNLPHNPPSSPVHQATKEIPREGDSFHDLVHSAKSELIRSSSMEHKSRSNSLDSDAGDTVSSGARRKTRAKHHVDDKVPTRQTRAKKQVQQNNVCEEMDCEPSLSPSF